MRTNHEYKVLKFAVTGWPGGKLDGDDMETQLNLHGEDGWELMNICPVLIMGQTATLVATMKRQLQT